MVEAQLLTSNLKFIHDHIIMRLYDALAIFELILQYLMGKNLKARWRNNYGCYLLELTCMQVEQVCRKIPIKKCC